MDPLWEDTPVPYKSHYVVQTYFYPKNTPPVYLSYILDKCFVNQPAGTVSYVSTFTEWDAKIAHENFIHWVIRYKAHLKVYPPCNHETIGAPKTPSHRHSRPVAIPPPPVLQRVPTLVNLPKFDYGLSDDDLQRLKDIRNRIKKRHLDEVYDDSGEITEEERLAEEGSMD